MIEIKETDLNGVLLRTNTFAYDSKKRLSATTYGAVGQTYRPIYEKNASGHEYPDDVVVGIKLDGKFADQTTKDGLGRVATRTLTVENSPLLTENYSYLKTALASGKTIETAIVSGTTCQIGSASANTSYTYDISGNIETVTVDSVLVAKYHYDKWNRIVREDNHKFGKTYTWEYDIGGNITEKRTYALCTGDAVGGEYTSDNYEYATSGWKDQLTSFNGEVCEYDALGNPTTYRGKTLNWTKVRRLAKFGDVEFTYNANGTRTSKTANGITHTYTLIGGSVVKEADGTNTLIYYIGGNGFVGFNCNGIDYYYRKNPQGDVIGIYTSSGVKAASYVYDAWGNHKIFDANGNEVTSTTHIGYINPIRYRGYYFDVETGLYYLKTRYYDPQIGRFISSDDIKYLRCDQLMGLNLYAYCSNNAVMFLDPFGRSKRDFYIFINDLKNKLDCLEQEFKRSLKATGKALSDGLNSLGQGIAALPQNIYSALTVDIGVGGGIGGSVECDGMEATALVRGDILSVRKDSGDDFYLGRTDEQYIAVEGLYSLFQSGQRTFYDTNMNVIIPTEELYPTYDFTSEVGVGIYVGIGLTLKIGFDWNYFLTQYGLPLL